MFIIYTYKDLQIMQSWSLERKVWVTQLRIMEWYKHFNGKVKVSFSGGVDSLVLLDLARRIYPEIGAVFVNTTMEYPEIVRFVKGFDNVDIITPKISYTNVIEKYGYPVISKEVSNYLSIQISPEYEPKYLTADEYLSGNVREKLSQAEQFAQENSEYRINAEYLQKVQPKDLTASEISVKLGTTWIPEKYIKEFIFELLSPNSYAEDKIEVRYFNNTGEWNIQGKSADKGVKATNTYGTKRISAYKIIEDSLNLRDVRIFDYIYDENGNICMCRPCV